MKIEVWQEQNKGKGDRIIEFFSHLLHGHMQNFLFVTFRLFTVF